MVGAPEHMTSPDDKITDAQLLKRYRAGDEEAFTEIVHRYKNPLYAFLRRFLNRHDLVEDVFQDTFLQLYSSQGSFDVTRPLHPWLFTIATNKAKDALRKQQRRNVVNLGTITSSQDTSIEEVLNVLASDKDNMPDEKVSQNETEQQVRQIIADMPDNLREILILAYFKQFSYKQMAQILSIPIGTVKSRLHTAVVHFSKKYRAADRSDKI